MKYLVTIDRNEWAATKKYEVYKKEWWEDRLRKPKSQLGRTLFMIDREKESCEALFTLPQCLDKSVVENLINHQGWAGKAFARGLRTIKQTAKDTFVICDVFGAYETDLRGNVLRHVSLPIFTDLHSAFPNADNTRILLSSTGIEEIQEAGWDSKIYRRIAMQDVLRVNPSAEVLKISRQFPDHRLIPIKIQRELFHVNWAEWLDEGERMLVSMYVPGMIAILKFTGNEECHIERSWSYFPKCHAPLIDHKRGTLLVCISGTNQVTELDLETGKRIWTAENISFGKSISILDDKRVLVGDCNGRRAVELDRDTGEELWSLDLPGIPYDLQVLRK